GWRTDGRSRGRGGGARGRHPPQRGQGRAGPGGSLATMIPEEVRRLAEDPSAYAPMPPGFERVLNERFSLLLGPFPQMTMVQRVRLDPADVDAAVAEVRELAGEHD